MAPIGIEVGQQWITRSGVTVRICCDRGESNTWRWALSNSEMVTATGRAHYAPAVDHPCDLIKQIKEQQ